MDLKQLSKCPEHLEAVGTWIYEQWWRKPDNKPEVVLCRSDLAIYSSFTVRHG